MYQVIAVSLENFKKFVKTKPALANYVTNGEATWQKFYDMYELYGESSPVWDKYLTSANTITLKEVFGMIKNIDVTEVQNSIKSLQKGIGYIEELVRSKEKEIPVRKSTYEARPLYRYFDD